MDIYFIATILFMIEILLATFSARYALSVVLLIILLIPGVIKFNVGINLNVFNTAVAIFMLSVFLLKKNRNNNIVALRKILIIYAIYVSLTSFFTFGNVVPFSDYFRNILLFILAFIGLPYALSYVKLDEQSIKCFNWVVLIGGLAIIGYGIFNYITAFNPYMAYVALVADLDVDMSNAFQEEQRGILMGRVSSTFVHPLHLGQCALLLFSYSFYQLRRKVNMILLWVYLLGLILMCVLCGSRSAIFPMVLIPAIYVLHMKRTKVMRYIILFFMAIMISYPMLPKQTRATIEGLVLVWNEKAANKADIRGSSIEGRLEQIEAAFRIIKDNPLFGKGEGYVNTYGFRHPEMLGYESIILRYLVEGGIVGLIVFLWFYFQSYKLLLSYCKKREEKAEVHSLCFSFFVSILLTGISYSFYTLYMIFYFATLNSLANKHQKSNLLYENRSYHPQLQ